MKELQPSLQFLDLNLRDLRPSPLEAVQRPPAPSEGLGCREQHQLYRIFPL
jgi:hypothetical protein